MPSSFVSDLEKYTSVNGNLQFRSYHITSKNSENSQNLNDLLLEGHIVKRPACSGLASSLLAVWALLHSSYEISSAGKLSS